VEKLTHASLKAKALADPEVKAAYDALEPQYKLIAELLRARKKSGLTQAQVAVTFAEVKAHQGFLVQLVIF